ncbi:hypothetical protein ABID22_004146 [Pontibacter aydingkolensis]
MVKLYEKYSARLTVIWWGYLLRPDPSLHFT